MMLICRVFVDLQISRTIKIAVELMGTNVARHQNCIVIVKNGMIMLQRGVMGMLAQADLYYYDLAPTARDGLDPISDRISPLRTTDLLQYQIYIVSVIDY